METSSTDDIFVIKKDTLLAKTCIDGNLCNVFYDGENGSYIVVIEENAKQCIVSAPMVQADVNSISDEYRAMIDNIPLGISTDENILAALRDTVRYQRNNLLLNSDWTQLPDVPQATKDLWAPYRQALRDITLQPSFPTDITWPVVPT